MQQCVHAALFLLVASGFNKLCCKFGLAAMSGKGKGVAVGVGSGGGQSSKGQDCSAACISLRCVSL